MDILVFVIMALITLAGLGYPLWRRPTAAVAAPVPERVVQASAAPEILCVNCGRALKVDERFCPGCGTQAGDRCTNCGRALDGDELFCPGCGTKTGQA